MLANYVRIKWTTVVGTIIQRILYHIFLPFISVIPLASRGPINDTFCHFFPVLDVFFRNPTFSLQESIRYIFTSFNVGCILRITLLNHFSHLFGILIQLSKSSKFSTLVFNTGITQICNLPSWSTLINFIPRRSLQIHCKIQF